MIDGHKQPCDEGVMRAGAEATPCAEDGSREHPGLRGLGAGRGLRPGPHHALVARLFVTVDHRATSGARRPTRPADLQGRGPARRPIARRRIRTDSPPRPSARRGPQAYYSHSGGTDPTSHSGMLRAENGPLLGRPLQWKEPAGDSRRPAPRTVTSGSVSRIAGSEGEMVAPAITAISETRSTVRKHREGRAFIGPLRALHS